MNVLDRIFGFTGFYNLVNPEILSIENIKLFFNTCLTEELQSIKCKYHYYQGN